MVAGGIPDGARWTPVPDLLFSRWLPEVEDPVVLKVGLHVLWRVYRRPKGAPPALRVDDVAADATLHRGLAALDVAEAARETRVRTALDRLVADGWLIEARLPDAAGPARWVLVNGREGRRAYARLEAGDLVLPERPPPADVATGERPNIFALYEDNIGLLTPLLAEELDDASNTYPPTWIEDAFRLAVENNVRKWSYIRTILERWAKEGRADEADQRGDQAARARDAEGPYAAFIES